MDQRPRIVGVVGDLEVHDNALERRYEARQDGVLAGRIDYTPHDGWLTLDHTEVLAAFEGRGVAGRLVTAALDDIRARSMHVTPLCPYVAAFIKRHPEYGDLVVGVRGPRARGSG
jgi:predicted GNAT family acetyltransferase